MKFAHSNESFYRLPMRVGKALERGELTFLQHAVLVCLVYLVYESHSDGQIEIGLAALAERVGWRHTSEHLRNVVHRLASDGWIAATVPKGGRTWVITLSRAAVIPRDGAQPPTDLQLRERHGLEVREPELEVENALRSAAERDAASPSSGRLEVALSPSPVSADLQRELLNEEQDVYAGAREPDESVDEEAFIQALGEIFGAVEIERASAETPLCRYLDHRVSGFDWDDRGRPVCGVCHPDPARLKASHAGVSVPAGTDA